MDMDATSHASRVELQRLFQKEMGKFTKLLNKFLFSLIKKKKGINLKN